MTQGVWADIGGVHSYVGNSGVPVNQSSYADVAKFLSDHGFVHEETSATPSPGELPAGTEKYVHGNRVVEIDKTVTPYGFETILEIRVARAGQELIEAQNDPILTVGDLVNFVTLGREVNAPQDGGVAEMKPAEKPESVGYAIPKNVKFILGRKFKKGWEQANAANPTTVAQNPVGGGNVRFEEWNMWRETDLTEPEEIEVHVDPETGEITVIEIPVPVEAQYINPNNFPTHFDQNGQPLQQQAGTQYGDSAQQAYQAPVYQPQVKQDLAPAAGANYIRLQQRPPEDFKGGYVTTEEGGVRVVRGQLKDGNRAIQAILLPKDQYTRETASQWARQYGFKVGTQPVDQGVKAEGFPGFAGARPMQVMPAQQTQAQPAQAQPTQPKADMPGYAGMQPPRPAMGVKYVYDKNSKTWIHKGYEVALQGTGGGAGIFCDFCHTAIGRYVQYKSFRICQKCANRYGRAHVAK